MPRECGVRTVCCIHGHHAAVGELLACKREWKNAVGMNCGSKLLLDTEQCVCCESQVQKEAVSREITSQLHCENIYKYMLNVMIICCKMTLYFVLLFMRTTKIFCDRNFRFIPVYNDSSCP